MKNKIKQEILDKISIMEQNTFLFPKSWSNITDMINEDWSYKTYNAERTGINRYHNIDIYKINEKIIEINFRGDGIYIVRNLDLKRITYKDVLYYVSAIFDEKHSFKNHSEGKRKIRETINKKITEIKMVNQAIIDLKKQLTDLNELK